MPELFWGLIVGGSGGGVLGYWLRARVDERVAERKEARQFKQADLRALRDDLLIFLGAPRADYYSLESARNVRAAGGSPSPDEKARLITEWVYKNASRYPKSRRAPMNLIANVVAQLAAGERRFLDENPKGYEAMHDAWESLDDYAHDLSRQLHGT